VKRALAALALIAGLLPALASAQTVRRTFGLGNVFEPTAACGTDGCQILIYVEPPIGVGQCNPGLSYTEAGCARRGPDEMISSGLLIQSSRFYSYYPIPGTFTIEEDTTGAVTIVSNPDGTTSGHVNNVFLDLDLGFDTFLIPSALNFDYNGGTGTHINDAQGDRIVWNNPVPYNITGCLTCQSGSGSGCALIGLAPPPPLVEGDPVCDNQVQPGDPHQRNMPNWVSTDGFDTWRFPDNGDGTFTGGDESIVADAADIGGVNNGGGWIFFGFKDRECGTKNPSEGDPFHPNLGKPDTDCDGNADWAYGLGGVDEPACFDTTRWCTGTTTTCDFDSDCNLAGGETCDALPEKVCSGTSTECFINSDCTAPATCVALGQMLCTGTATSCTSNADCTAPATCDPRSTAIPTSGGDYVCRPIADCGGPHTPGTPCPAGCFENSTLPSLCQKIDRSLVQRTSALSLMRDPDHDHFPTRGRVQIVEDMDGSDTRWCSGGSAISGSSKLTPRRFCTSAADCPSGETCDLAGTQQWCSGTSTPCTVDADCGFGSLCSRVGPVYIPVGSESGWNTNSVIVATVPNVDTFVITAAGRTFLDGAVGHGSPADVIVWNGSGPTSGLTGPYKTGPYGIPLGGCYYCQGNLLGTCSTIFLFDRLTTCNQGQIGDPQVREYPDMASFDGGDTLGPRYPNGRLGDTNPGHIAAVVESFQSGIEANLTTNRGPTVLYAYLQRECGTMNDPNGGNTALYEFCSLEDEFCTDATAAEDCPPINASCNQALGKCNTPGQEACATAADCPLQNQTCSRPAGNPFNPRSGKADRDCDRKVDPGVFPIASDPGDPEFPADLALPPDLTQDVCITYVQRSDADSNGDGHGNRCSCGDQNSDGAVNVSDIVDINLAIFNPALATLLCDTQNDSLCNVSDIVNANIEIFSPGTTATCVYNLLPTTPCGGSGGGATTPRHRTPIPRPWFAARSSSCCSPGWGGRLPAPPRQPPIGRIRAR
jgi:hypothetical protein